MPAVGSAMIQYKLTHYVDFEYWHMLPAQLQKKISEHFIFISCLQGSFVYVHCCSESTAGSVMDFTLADQNSSFSYQQKRTRKQSLQNMILIFHLDAGKNRYSVSESHVETIFLQYGNSHGWNFKNYYGKKSIWNSKAVGKSDLYIIIANMILRRSSRK